jgi:signal transduction histidine kinase
MRGAGLRELRDTLLQSFQGLMLRFQAVDEMLPTSPMDAKKALEGALEQADQALLEGRDAIKDMRAPSVRGDLAQSMNTLMTDWHKELSVGNHDSVTFRVVVEGAPQTVLLTVRDEIYLVAREALRNAIRYAQARQIEAEITYDDRLLRLRFRDDGKGIDARILERGGRSGHWGLVGMCERAKRIGGQLEVWSRAGAGTEVELSIPGSIAYQAPAKRAGFWVFRKRTRRNYEHQS